jgi:hypothetical protein
LFGLRLRASPLVCLLVALVYTMSFIICNLCYEGSRVVWLCNSLPLNRTYATARSQKNSINMHNIVFIQIVNINMSL